jgi:hypothetical protein
MKSAGKETPIKNENRSSLIFALSDAATLEQTHRLSSQGKLCAGSVNLRFGASLIQLNISARQAVKAIPDAARIEAF